MVSVSHRFIANQNINSHVLEYGKNRYVHKKQIHITSSNIQYRCGNFVWQFLHFHFWMQKLRIGISSIALRVLSHLSHFDLPKKIDFIHSLVHSLPITTPQKDPKIVHKINTIIDRNRVFILDFLVKILLVFMYIFSLLKSKSLVFDRKILLSVNYFCLRTLHTSFATPPYFYCTGYLIL